MPGRDSPHDYFGTGLTLSFLGHLILAGIFFVAVIPGFGDLGEPIVYSVSVEGGRTLGGESQVAKEEKSVLAPMKAVSQPKADEKVPEKVEEKKPEPVKPEKEVPPEDAEVSTNEAKPTPQPVKPTPPPTPKATQPPPVKPTAAPTAKPTVKVDPKEKAKAEKNQVDKSYDEMMKQYDRNLKLKQYTGESSEAGGKGFGAAKLGGNGMGGGIGRPAEFFAYRDMVQAKLREALRWSDPQSQLVAEIFFTIDQDGTVRNIEVQKRSGDSAFDQAAGRAVEKVNPLPPPPENVYEFFKKGFTAKIRANE